LSKDFVEDVEENGKSMFKSIRKQEANNGTRTFKVGSIDIVLHSGFLFCAHISKDRTSGPMASAKASAVLVMFFDKLALYLVESTVVQVRVYESTNTKDRKWRRRPSVIVDCARDDKMTSSEVWLRSASKCFFANWMR
jgi:hypothetical protein